MKIDIFIGIRYIVKNGNNIFIDNGYEQYDYKLERFVRKDLKSHYTTYLIELYENIQF